MASVALLSLPAMAQTVQTTQAAAATSQLYQMKAGQWRGTKLTGLNVYNNNNEKIGDVKEIILDRTGKIDAIVIAAGGFLGMGNHDVAVPFQQVKWLDERGTTNLLAVRPIRGQNGRFIEAIQITRSSI